MLSANHDINPESLIGRAVKLVIGKPDGSSQPIHGMVRSRLSPIAQPYGVNSDPSHIRPIHGRARIKPVASSR